MSAMWAWSATEARRRLARGEATAEALVAACLDRIASQNPTLNAFLTVCADRALEEARATDKQGLGAGPLAGLPFAVKDLTDTAGVRTTYGSAVYADHTPSADELCVARLRAAGAILVGKTNTPEFGFGPRSGNRLAAPTANPHDLSLSAGGSSGGSAAAVAAGLVALAHGTDFGGSVRTPASFCGVVGLRPTPGVIPSATKPLAWNALSTHGVLARTVEDAGLMLSVMSGYDARDPTARPGSTGVTATVDVERFAVGGSADLGVAPVSRAVRAAFSETLAKLSARFRVEEASPDCRGAMEAFATLRAALVHRQFAPLVAAHGDQLTAPLIWNAARGAGLTAEDWLAAEAARSRVYAAFARYFERHDILVTPAAAVPPFAVAGGDILAIDGAPLSSAIDYLAITSVVSLVGFPCLSLPAGWIGPGSPFGLQIVAPPFREDRLLAFARTLEADLGFRHVWPSGETGAPSLANEMTPSRPVG